MLQDIIFFMISYLMVFLVTFLVLNFGTHGFVKKYLIVWASRGSKILIRVNGLTKWYIATGKLTKDNTIEFKNLGKSKIKLKCVPGDVNRWHGVNSLLFDEYSGSIIRVDLSAEDRANPAFYSDLNDRIIKTANADGSLSSKTITLWLFVLTLLVVIVGVLVFKTYEVVNILNAPPPVGVI